MRKLNTALFAAFLGCTAIISPALAETANITFLLTNDIYKVDNDNGDLQVKGLYFGGVARF